MVLYFLLNRNMVHGFRPDHDYYRDDHLFCEGPFCNALEYKDLIQASFENVSCKKNPPGLTREDQPPNYGYKVSEVF